jgi:hypothetical protein
MPWAVLTPKRRELQANELSPFRKWKEIPTGSSRPGACVRSSYLPAACGGIVIPPFCGLSDPQCAGNRTNGITGGEHGKGRTTRESRE